jgi:hypothetical protein
MTGVYRNAIVQSDRLRTFNVFSRKEQRLQNCPKARLAVRFVFLRPFNLNRFGPASYCNVSWELRESTADIHQESVNFEVFFFFPFPLSGVIGGKVGGGIFSYFSF